MRGVPKFRTGREKGEELRVGRNERTLCREAATGNPQFHRSSGANRFSHRPGFEAGNCGAFRVAPEAARLTPFARGGSSTRKFARDDTRSSGAPFLSATINSLRESSWVFGHTSMELFNRMTKFAISPDESIAKTDEAKTKNRMELRLTRGFLLSR